MKAYNACEEGLVNYRPKRVKGLQNNCVFLNYINRQFKKSQGLGLR